MDRKSATFAGVDGVLDIDPAADAGDGNGRPRVAVAADGVATVVWGESGNTYARRVFESRLSLAPQSLAEGSELPDIDTEDDSSYAWAVARQTADGHIVARRLVGSAFNDPVSIDGGTRLQRAEHRHQRQGRRLRGDGHVHRRRGVRRGAQGRQVQPGDLPRRRRRQHVPRRGHRGERRRPDRLRAGRPERARRARAPLRLRRHDARRDAARARRAAVQARARPDRRRARPARRRRPRRRRRGRVRPGRGRRRARSSRRRSTARPARSPATRRPRAS